MLERVRTRYASSSASQSVADVATRGFHWCRGILMRSLAQKMHRFLVSEAGPTAVEYAVMLALIVIVCLASITAIGTNASTTFNKVAKSL